MARPASITQEEVESAVTALEGNGKPINPYQVRKVLNKGSIAKIGYYLKALGLDAVYEVDDPLTTRLALLLRPAALELQEQTDERIRIETETLRNNLHERDVVLADLESRLEEKQSELEIQKKRLNQVTIDRDWLRSEKQLLEVKVARFEETHKGQEKQLQAQFEQIAFLKEKNSDTQKEFQSALSEHREIIRTMREDHQKTVVEYKESVSSITHKLHKLIELNDHTVAENDQLKQDAIKLTNAYQNAVTEAEAELELLHSEKNKYVEETQKLAVQYSALAHEKDALAQKLHSETQSLDRQLATELSRSERLASDNKKLVSDLEFLKTLINKFEIPLATKSEETPDS